MIRGTLYDFFADDHQRLEMLFEDAVKTPENVDEAKYHAFRTGLLRHIKMEERILFKAAQAANGGEKLPLQGKLKLDHGALTAV